MTSRVKYSGRKYPKPCIGFLCGSRLAHVESETNQRVGELRVVVNVREQARRKTKNWQLENMMAIDGNDAMKLT